VTRLPGNAALRRDRARAGADKRSKRATKEGARGGTLGSPTPNAWVEEGV